VSAQRATALKAAAVLAFEQDDYAQAHVHFEASLAVFQQLHDPRGIATSHSNLGVVAMAQGNYAQAATLHQQAMRLWQDLGDQRGIAGSLAQLGWLAHDQGDYVQATHRYAESLAAWRALGDQAAIAGALANKGWATLDQGDVERARELLEESLVTCRELGIAELAALLQLGRVALAQQDYAQARGLLAESMAVFAELSSRKDFAQCLESVAQVATGQGQFQRAARLFGAAAALCAAHQIVLPPIERAQYDDTIALVGTHLGTAAFAAAWAEGRAMTQEQAIAAALADAAESRAVGRP
jgi:tetratricopeptide (TPR) repeat protein